ncbi:aldo/keto reductase [Streptomyces yunnanensis]|uniref:Predicted oxidoreductase n=1 Tax=Streptomyces yunnanensis TaxID=156453 RepID=A0A9X8MY08_9ACTN|nr:aldo/keto reductase [Streptomyces yunnanensis]SHM24885.1 Predicted oxidoreductase [Streptomyces yunnanensis]
MNYVKLGGTDLTISRIALGCMGFGGSGRGHNPWALDEEAAAPVFRRAVELGITFWDTANVYGGGASEELVGRAVRRYTRREDVVLATKVGLPTHDGPGGSGLSREAILAQVDGSLTRLGTDYLDLYQLHRFDPATPVEETVAALREVVAAGKVRYVGASSMWAWQFAKLQHSAARDSGPPFVSMQHQYSLAQREEEREMFPLLADQGVGSLVWCPLASGRLARPYGQATGRSAGDPVARRFFADVDQPIVDAVQSVAGARGLPMAQVALSWVLDNPVVTAPVVGATRPGHLDDATAALDVRLTGDELAALERPYTPRLPTGF